MVLSEIYQLLSSEPHRCEDATARKRYDGVAYFWRAYFYFEKLKRFGEVPWYDQVLASDQDELLAKPRDSRDVIINHIIEDCDKRQKIFRHHPLFTKFRVMQPLR